MDPYVAGVLVGIGSAAVVIAVMAAVRKKQGQPKAEYDERQLAARGIAYRWAYMTLIFSLLANTGVETIWGPWAKPGVAVWMMIFLSIGVFIVACVRKDAYFAVAQNPRTYLWLFGAVVVLQIPNIIISLRSGGFVEDGLLTWDALSPPSSGCGGSGRMTSHEESSAEIGPGRQGSEPAAAGGPGVRVPADHQRHRKRGL